MAVQIPTLDRTSAPEPASTGRIDYQGANAAAGEQQQTQAAEHTVGTIEHYVRTQQTYAANTAALAASTAYHNFREISLEGDPGDGTNPPVIGAKQMQGDPAPIYQKLNDSAASRKQAILDQYSDASDITQNAIKSALAGVDKKFADRQSVAYSAQSTQWTKNTTDAAAKIAANDVLDASSNVNIKDPEGSIQPLATALNKLSLIRNQEGAKLGGAEPIIPDPSKIDPTTGLPQITGYKNQTPQLQQQIAKEGSNAITTSVQNLLASGKIDEAKLVVSKFGAQIDGVNKVKIEKSMTAATDKQDAQNAFNQVKSLPQPEAFAKINADTSLSPDAQKKAQANLATYHRQMEQAQIGQDKMNSNAAQTIISKMQNEGTPFTDWNDAMNNPQIAALVGQIKDQKKVQSLQKSIDAPATSNSQVKADFYDLVFHPDQHDGGLKGMDPSDFSDAIAGLDKADRSVAKNLYMKANNPSAAHQTEQVRILGSQLTKELNSVGFVKKDQFGKYSNAEQGKLTQVFDEALQNMPDNMSPKELNQYVQNVAAAKIKGETFHPPQNTPPPPSKFLGKDEQPPPLDSYTIEAKENAMRAYYKKNGRWPNPVTELPQFMKENK